jgi:hypothetical protein
MKLRKIVSGTVRYDDSSVRKFRNASDLWQHLVMERNREWFRWLATADLDWHAIAKDAEQRKARTLEIKAAKRESASKPRSKITKAKLISYRGSYQSDHYGKTRGWKKAACIHFDITLKTLNRRMVE